jgi:hypothetical protein
LVIISLSVLVCGLKPPPFLLEDRVKLPDHKLVINSAEAAVQLDVTQLHIGDLCRRGKLAGQKIGGVWWVERASLADYEKFREFLPLRGRKAKAKA